MSKADVTMKLNKLTPNLIVQDIPASLKFWVDRLQFEKKMEVPHGDGIGFVILARGSAELMLQSRASLAGDVAPIAEGPHRAVLYLEVESLAPIRKALEGWPLVVPERKTFYGAQEIIVRDPDGHVVFFSEHQ
jgi:catechol 2,3-dioxygenase-like lactoylglutathione lyase family enzyme